MPIPTFEELYESLPLGYHSDKAKQDLRQKYDYLIDWMNREAQRAQQPHYELSRFFDSGGNQIVCQGALSDLSIRERNEYNFHFQNTSQWLFGFGLIFYKDTREFLIHT